jgi:hypothetical protein
VPACEGGFVVELVGRVPAKDDVAEFEALLQRVEEFVARQVFSANNAVEVHDPELDMGQAARLHQ